MSYFGQAPFNTNGGSILSKRNYINRKLDEIEQRLLELGWIEPEVEESEISEYSDMPMNSAGALLPYRDKVNKRLDFYEQVIASHTAGPSQYQSMNSNPYRPMTQPMNQAQMDFKESVNSHIADLFG